MPFLIPLQWRPNEEHINALENQITRVIRVVPGSALQNLKSKLTSLIASVSHTTTDRIYTH